MFDFYIFWLFGPRFFYVHDIAEQMKKANEFGLMVPLFSGKFQKQRSYEHTSVFDAVMLSIENLNEYHKTLYKSLAVFLDDVGIPSKVRIILFL